MKSADGSNRKPEEPAAGSAAPEHERSYAAFISYRHKPLDKEAAERIQKKIENYVVPKELREKAGGKKLGLVFRDEDELPASSSLTDSIYYALDHSRFLIVICTPDLPKSKWCEQEIHYFLKTHDRDHILAVLTDGDPAESFSPYLLHTFDADGNITGDREPLAANIAGPNHTIDRKVFRKEVVRLFAALIGCPFDELWQRERRAWTNRLLSAAGVALAVMAVFLGVVLNRNARIREQNEKITEQNDRIEEQNRTLQTQLSSVLVDTGRTKLEAFDVKGALADALDAVSSEDPAIYDHRALKLLADAQNAYQSGELSAEIVYEQNTDITQLLASDDESVLILKDRAGVIRGLDADTYDVLWEIRTGDARSFVYAENLGGRLIYQSLSGVYCHSLKDGSVVWAYEHPANKKNYFRVLAKDGSLFAAAEQVDSGEAQEEDSVNLFFLNTSDGSEAGRVNLALSTADTLRLHEYVKYYETTGTFSPDNRFFACALPSKEQETDEYGTAYFFVRLETMEATCLGIGAVHEYEYGMDIDPADQSVFFAGYSPSFGIQTGLFTWEDGEPVFAGKGTVHAFGAPGGFDSELNEVADNETMFLVRNGRAYVFSDNFWGVYDRAKNRLKRSFGLSDTIVAARWLDEEQGLLELASADGYVFDYYMKSYDEDGWMFSNATGSTIGAGIRKALTLGGSLFYGHGRTLVVPEQAPGRLIRVGFASDPNRQIFDYSEEYSIVYDVIVGDKAAGDKATGDEAAGDEADTGFLYNSYDAAVFDKNTGEIITSAHFDDYFNSEWVYRIGGDRFVQFDTEYHMDGTICDYGEGVELETYQLLEGSSEEVTFYARPYYHTPTSDGHLLSWSAEEMRTLKKEYADDFAEGESPKLLMVWVDGKPTAASTDPATGILLLDPQGDADDPVFCGGENGVIMACGRALDVSDGHLKARPEAQLFFMDAFTGQVTAAENVCPDAAGFCSAFAGKRHQMAAAYTDGTVCIYDTDTGEAQRLDADYGPDEVASMAFDPEDRVFLVLTSAGRIDVYDAAARKLLYSCMPDILKNWSGEHIGTDIVLDRLEAGYTPDGSYLYVMAALGTDPCHKCVLIDTEGWTIAAELDDVYAYDPDVNRLFCRGTKGRVITFPVYNLEMLKETAQERLKE